MPKPIELSLALLICLGYPCWAQEQDDQYESPTAELAFSYALAVTDSLAQGSIALHRTIDSQRKDGSIANNMKSFSLLRLELKQAQIGLQRYADAENKLISGTSTEITSVYSLLADLYDEYLDLLEQAMNDSDFAAQQGTYTRRFGDVSARIDNTWRMFPTAVAGVSFALVDTDVPDGSGVVRLVITQQQRDELINRLETGFPAVRERQQGKSGDLAAIDAAAQMLWTFLNDEWLSTDSQD